MFSQDHISSGLAEAFCSQQRECLMFVSQHPKSLNSLQSYTCKKSCHRKWVLYMYEVLQVLGIVMRWTCCGCERGAELKTHLDPGMNVFSPRELYERTSQSI